MQPIGVGLQLLGGLCLAVGYLWYAFMISTYDPDLGWGSLISPVFFWIWLIENRPESFRPVAVWIAGMALGGLGYLCCGKTLLEVMMG